MTQKEFNKLVDGLLSLSDRDALFTELGTLPYGQDSWQWMYDAAVKRGLLIAGRSAAELDGFG